MAAALSDHWSHREAPRTYDASVGPARIVGLARTVATPSNLLLAAAILAGWGALLTWTGAGPDGWQARSCAALDLGRTSCSAVRYTKDQSRIAPYAEAGSIDR